MIIAYENYTGLVLRGTAGELLEGELIVVERWQPATEYRKIARVAVVEVGKAGSLGVAPGGVLEGFDGDTDYLLRWVPDPPETVRDGRTIELGRPVFYTPTREGTE